MFHGSFKTEKPEDSFSMAVRDAHCLSGMNPRTREQKENRLFNKIPGIVTRSSLLLIKNLQGVSVPRARIQ